MNIFILDENPEVCAKYHTDKHIVKMPTETAQMISFVYHDKEIWDSTVPNFIMGFSKTHYKHPCSIWIRESLSNFLYACRLGIELYNEYQFRYNKPDKHQRAIQIFQFALQNPPKLQDKGLTDFALAMDEQYIKHKSAVENYREYYRNGKSHLFSWKNRQKPHFISPNF
jgi:hypothetical protein